MRSRGTALVTALIATVAIPLAVTSTATIGAAPPTELFVSEYIEGTSNNKALEIYNGTGAAVDLTTGGYNVQMFFNGSTSAGLTINLTGTVADGDVFVLAHSSAAPEILAEADQTNGAGWFNGDDAVVLRKGTAIVDVIGEVGFDPGTEWGSGLTSTADNTLRRKATICAGDTDPSDEFDPAVEWDGFATNTFDGLGAHTADCDGGSAPVATCPAALLTDEGVAASTTVSATDDDSAISSIVITSPPVPGISLGPPADGSAELTVATDTAPGTYAVVIEFATDDDPPQTTTCTVRVIVVEDVFIHDVQGSGPSSPLVGRTVRVEGIVTSPFTTADTPGGFFLQEEDADADTDPNTSEGVFVLTGAGGPPVAAGDKVQVMGAVTESFGMTQINASVAGESDVVVIGSSNPLPTLSVAPIPASGPTNSSLTFEHVEGMIVMIPGELAVSEYFQLARFGQLVLTADARPYQFTHLDPPSVDGNADYLAELATRRIILDDDNDDENDAITLPPDEPYPYPTGGLSNANKFRGGDTIEDLTGVMHWAFGAWRLRPIPGGDYSFAPVNEFPDAPTDVGGNVKVAAYNVLNYFTTIDITPSNNVGDCGPSGTLDCRGADSEAELVRQLDKIVAALSTMDAHVVGLIEIENDGDDSSVASIVAALNVTDPGRYDYISTGFIGTDAIKVALIYQPAVVTPVGAHTILDSTVDPTFIDTLNRPVLIQTFEENATGERFTVAVNHLKSKGSACAGDPDLLDGAGNCNVTRTNAAQALAGYLATDPTGSEDPDFLIIGDLNSYRMEDPITLLKVAAGYTDLIEHFLGDDAYSFVFDGQLGYLDHALATASLTSQVTGVTEWHTNADEVPLFDYNDTVRDLGESSFERESAALPLYEPNAVRASDHDPVIVGLCLDTEPPEIDISLSHDVLWPPLHQYVTVTADVTATDNCDPDPQIDLVSVTSNEPDDGVDDGNTINDIVIEDDFTFQLRAERSGVGTGRVYTVTYMATDASGNEAIGTATVSVPLSRGR